MSVGGWGLANPWGLLWCLLAVPIVLLHVLRPRRIQAKVAAVFLWRRVATPVSAARPWQRLIPSWLLAAQVLAAVLLGLLMARPVRLGDQLLAEHTIFVVDASASMQANDGSPDRLAAATERARELRRQVPAGGQASLIVAGADARALVTRSTDTDAFDTALRTIRAADGPADMASAFALAAGLDTGETDSRVVFVSDGGVTPADLRAAPTGTRYEAVGTSATNRGITQLSVEPAAEGLVARVAVTHFGGPAVDQKVRIDVDGITVATRDIHLDPGGVANLSIPLAVTNGAEKVEAFLDGEDALALDDRAVATLAQRPEIQVLWAGADNPFLEAALGSVPGVVVTRAPTVPATPDPAIDVVVADQVAVPDGLTLPVLAIAPPGGARGITAGGTVERPVVTLIRAEEPLVEGLDLSQVFVAQAQQLTAPSGSEVVVGAEGAPLLIRTDTPAPTVYLGFALDQSTLPLDAAFPILIDRSLASLSDLVAPPARLTVGADLPVDPRLEATITAPDGTAQTIPPGSSYPRADRIGFWRVDQGDRSVLLAVGAARGESAIAPAPDLPFDTAFAGRGPAPRRGEIPYLWPVIGILLALLVAEWLLARRRLGVGPRQWRTATGLRVAVAAALLAVLFTPSITRKANDVATLFLIDASDSMTAGGRAQAVDTVRQALAQQPDKSRAGIVVFGNDARLETLVSREPTFSGVSVEIDPAATDLAAAMRLGAAALPADARRRLVLISDGRATTGDAAQEAARLEADGIPVDVVVVDPPAGTDVAVGGIEVPSLARNGEQINVDVQVTAPRDTEGEVVLRRDDGTEVGRRTVPLKAGANTVRFTDTAAGEGVLRYQAEVSTNGDAVKANDLGFAAVPVEGADAVLVVAGRDGAGAGLVAELQAAGLTVATATPASLPAIDELTRYASIVLADVDRRDLSDAQVSDLTAAVRDLGRGMLVLGGTHSYALGGYRDSDLEQILPVVSEITDPLRRQTVAEVLAIDTSGSMAACHCSEEGLNGLGNGNRIGGGVEKTAIARSAAAKAIAALSATDEVGVLSMDADDRWVIDLQAAPSQDVVDEGLSQIVPDGPTFLDSGLATAAEALRKSDANLKHIIVFSDGFTEPANLAAMADQAAALAAEGITVSVVATGEGAAKDLEPVAEAGGGRFYPGRNLSQIPDVIVQEAVLASRDFVTEGEFLPIIGSSRPSVANLSASPALLGYVATSPKPTASVDLLIGPDQDPLLASWQAGLGRVAAWTSDGGERWSTPWNGWDGGPDFWAGVVKDTFPASGAGGGIQAKVTDGQLNLRLEGAEDWPEDASATVRVAGPDGSSTVVPLERIDGSTFAATVPADQAGTYALGAVVTDGADTVWSGVGLTTRSYPAEYAPRPVGRDELTRLAEVTGGRVDPAAAELFSSLGTKAGERRYDLTRWFLWFALLAWPVAVAVSRLAWRRGLLAEGAGKAATTVGELRARMPRMAEPKRPFPTPQGSPSPGPPDAPASVPTSPPTTPSPTPAAPAPAPAAPAPAPAPAADGAAADGGSTVSELLARKRRRS